MVNITDDYYAGGEAVTESEEEDELYRLPSFVSLDFVSLGIWDFH